jgi:hypothetical protein
MTTVAVGDAVLDADGWPAPMIAGRTIGVDTISHGVLPDQRVFQSAGYDLRGSASQGLQTPAASEIMCRSG